jgi:valyl-tRNA synthetase
VKLSKTYEPAEYEEMIYELWEKSGAFAPKQEGEPYVTVLPPPNANANLHIGYALNIAIIDAVARYQRLKGRAVLALPGADHAGFETQVVYEKQLAKQGKSRFDLTREELYSGVYDFVQENKHNFEQQIRSLGASVDWTRFTFTLDAKIVATAHNTFQKLWQDKLIYRGERLVNYCTFHRTSFADIEVVHEDTTSPLYYLKYGPFTLATTRPETKFGDTAVAVHPDDERYKDYIGKTITAEGLEGPFEIRVVADTYVDPAFGTGAVKITPAHDFNDWEVAIRHNLEAIRVINHDGTLNHRAGQFAGMQVLEARAAVVAALKEKGLLERVNDQHKNRVGKCYKCGTVIEPMLMDQWFIDMKRLAAPAIAALRAQKITFYPEAKGDQIIAYLESVKDWNISRQIAWGIPIPAFQNVADSDDWIFDDRVGSETIEVDGKTYRRDPDVFDTWFSSGQWPFATLDYPDGADFNRFYPNDLMQCGVDILYPWVSRMICLGLYVTGKIPFKTVYLHGMVRSEDGRKMSKSLGNVIDPQNLLASHGADAVRMGMLAGRSAGFSAAYAPSKIDAARNFCNKLWNIARFVEGVIGDNPSLNRGNPRPVSVVDDWILYKLTEASQAITHNIEVYRFSEAYEVLYHLVWDDFADWYIEASKTHPNNEVLAFALETILKLAHPFAPFVTETIWQTLKWEADSLLIASSWPTLTYKANKEVSTFEDLRAIITEVRSIIKALGVGKVTLYHTHSELLSAHGGLIAKLAHLQNVKAVTSGRGLHLTQTDQDCWLDIDHETAVRYLDTLQQRQSEQALSVERLSARLANKAYVANAPNELVEETKGQLELARQQLSHINNELATFKEVSDSFDH